MSYYVIGIGGTGARCLEAFVYLNGAGLLKDRGDVTMIFVDADVSCGNLLRAKEAADSYDKAVEIGYGHTGIMQNKLNLVGPCTPVPDKCRNLDEALQVARLDTRSPGNEKALEILYRALYTEQERTTSLDKGFRGHPAIGAAVICRSFGLKAGVEWQETINRIKNDEDARIFLFASAFGGTGAAGFPTIARIMSSGLRRDKEDNVLGKIGGCLVLPYFGFPHATGEEAKEMQAKEGDFILNTRAALRYYINDSDLLKNVFNAVYLVGDSKKTYVKKFSLGANSQENEANTIEVYAALAAFDFFNKYEKTVASKGEEECPTFLIGRGKGEDDGFSDDVIEWDDLPNPCVGGDLKTKLGAYIKFLYVYRSVILPSIEGCIDDEKRHRKVRWYKDLVLKEGVDLHNNNQKLGAFKALGAYADGFFRWLKQLTKEDKHLQMKLINESVVEKPSAPDKMVDIHKIILPDQTGSFTYLDFWQLLCDYDKGKTNNSGSSILMQAVFDLCNK